MKARLRRLAIAIASGAAITATVAPADADTSVWTRAANPESFERDVLLAKVDALMNEYFHLRQMPAAFRRSQALGRARRMLERAGAASSEDVTVRLRLAQVYYNLYEVDGDQDRLEQAIVHYQWAIAAPLPSLTKARVLNTLAIALARLARHEEEIAAYDQAIALEPEPAAQAVLRANQAEGFMAQGQILKAIRGYRAALDATPTWLLNVGGGATTMWGLAVALDRSGDLQAALEQIGRARSYDAGDDALRSSNWFFVPPYDEDWYAALGHWQRARALEPTDNERLVAYDAAVAAWRSYMNRAPMEDQWLPLAAVRLQSCERERERARERLARARRERGDRPAPRKDLQWPE